MYKQISCDPGLTNPFCLENRPTDPYLWIDVSDLQPNQWTYAALFDPAKNYEFANAALYDMIPYVCNNPTGCIASAEPGADWILASALPSDHTMGLVTAGCTSSASANAQTGMCETSAPKGLGAECVNPCMRLQNGRLAVTRDTASCRIFGTATSGGLQAPGDRCATVCPATCVELWETCPPGTAPVTTLLQTKKASDLLSLTGPYRQDGQINPLWPTNYAYKDLFGNAIVGKPYTECYSYNTSFCDLPGARQESSPDITNTTNGLVTLRGATSCYAACPIGTFQSQFDSKLCLFNPVNAADMPPNYGPDTEVQKVFCNPQYFNPAYWLEDALLESGPQQAEALLKAGVQKGCRSIPLPSKSTETCPLGTSPVINEFFNLEWCVPDCPNGFFFDLSQSNCVAACYQTGDASSVPIYLDVVDYYATTDRCLPGVDCKANGVPGMCPATNDTRQLNSTQQNGSCPRGMQLGQPSRLENTELCYDVCMPGYEPVSTCPNFAQTCSPNERSYMCRAKCPETTEGLGPWKTIDSSPVFTCQYNYPGPVPSDPNLWVPCPADGRYEILQYLPTDVAVSVATAFRQEPLCIRKTYLRNVTCPLGSNPDGLSCKPACDSADLVITLPDGTVVCQSPSTSANHDTDFDAIADAPNAKPGQRSRVLVRQTKTRGLGSDPQQPAIAPATVPKANLYIIVGAVIVTVVIFIVVIRYLLK